MQDKTVEKRELTEQVVKQVGEAMTLTEKEAQSYYKRADHKTESARTLATLACVEYKNRVGKRRAFNTPSSLMQQKAMLHPRALRERF